MSLTIVTINRNHVHGLQRTQQSLLRQRNQDFNWIVIDGASTDGSVKCLTSRADLIVSEIDKGIYDAMNKGLKLSRGSHVWFLNSGDELFDPSVTNEVIHCTRNSKFIYGDIKMTGAKIIRSWKAGRFSKLKLYLGWHPPHPAFIFHNQASNSNYTRFNLKYLIAADYEFMIKKLLEGTPNITYLDKTLVKMELGGVSNRNIKNIFLANLECSRSWCQFVYIPAYWLLIFKPAWKIFQIRIQK